MPVRVRKAYRQEWAHRSREKAVQSEQHRPFMDCRASASHVAFNGAGSPCSPLRCAAGTCACRRPVPGGHVHRDHAATQRSPATQAEASLRGALGIAELQRLKLLAEEDRQLKQLVADLCPIPASCPWQTKTGARRNRARSGNLTMISPSIRTGGACRGRNCGHAAATDS